jgi:hypothetical protein
VRVKNVGVNAFPLVAALFWLRSQPSAALAAQADVKGALDMLFLGLGTVALLVGAIGVANIMIISVLERRQEIGLRRALGATRARSGPSSSPRRSCCSWSAPPSSPRTPAAMAKPPSSPLTRGHAG